MENKETKVSIMSERERKDNNNDGIRKNENAWAEWNRNVLEVERLTGEREREEEEKSNSIKCSKFVFGEEGEWAVEACPDLYDPPKSSLNVGQFYESWHQTFRDTAPWGSNREKSLRSGI